MSTQIPVSFVEQYKANLYILSQQKGSKFRSCVSVESVTGQSAYFERLGATAAVPRITRHGDTPLVDTPHTRRKVSLTPYEWADLIDDSDKVRLLINPQSDYALNAVNAMGRTMDDLIIAAVSGNAYGGVAGATAIPIPVGQQVAAGAANLTLAKLLSTKQVLDQAEVDPGERYLAVSPAMLSAILNVAEFKSSDYNTVKALVRGEIDTFLGFKWITTNRLAANSTANGHLALAWHKRAMGLAMGAEIKTRISERDDKAYSTQVYVSMDLGATRIEDEGVVEIDCIGG
jgi:hypothetical protein